MFKKVVFQTDLIDNKSEKNGSKKKNSIINIPYKVHSKIVDGVLVNQVAAFTGFSGVTSTPASFKIFTCPANRRASLFNITLTIRAVHGTLATISILYNYSMIIIEAGNDTREIVNLINIPEYKQDSTDSSDIYLSDFKSNFQLNRVTLIANSGIVSRKYLEGVYDNSNEYTTTDYNNRNPLLYENDSVVLAIRTNGGQIGGNIQLYYSYILY